MRVSNHKRHQKKKRQARTEQVPQDDVRLFQRRVVCVGLDDCPLDRPDEQNPRVLGPCSRVRCRAVRRSIGSAESASLREVRKSAPAYVAMREH